MANIITKPFVMGGLIRATSSKGISVVGQKIYPLGRRLLSTTKKKDAADVPIVDMSLPDHQLGAAVHEACTTVGFFHVINHGVSENLRSRVLEQARTMFTTLSEEQKETFSVAHSNAYRGYQRIGVNITLEKQDGHEGFDIMSESPSAPRFREDGLTLQGPNLWPDPHWMPQLRPTVEQEYIPAMVHVGNRLMSAASIGLGLGNDFFKPYFTDPYWSMRLLRYPVASPDDKPQNNDGDYEFGAGEHSDYGCFTMILCDPVKDTLQIRPKNTQEWRTVDPLPGGFICNIGDMLARWTNGIYVSTPHRVLRPSQDRVSVPFFFDPNYDSLISPIDQLVAQSELQAPCFEPTMYGDYLVAKLSNNFKL